MNSLTFMPERAEPRSFLGRTREVRTLRRHLARGVPVCIVHGLGGVGKTELVNQALDVGADASRVIWRSLRDAPPFSSLVASVLSRHPTPQDDPSGEPIARLLRTLRASRTVLVLDNLDAVLPVADGHGGDREYEELLAHLVRGEVGGPTVVATSRVLPQLPTAASSLVKTMHLRGLEDASSRRYLKRWRLQGTTEELTTLATLYMGNPYALSLAAELIVDLYRGVVASYLDDGHTVFGGINELFDEHFDVLLPLERLVMFRLAAAREPLTFRALVGVPALAQATDEVPDALQQLRRRSLVERHDGTWYLLYLVQEYCLGRLVETTTEELATRSSAGYLADLPLVDATQPIWVRRTQDRLTRQRLIGALKARIGTESGLEETLGWALERSRRGEQDHGTFLAANVAGMHAHLAGGLMEVDFSRTCLRRLDLSRERLMGTSFRECELENCRFASAHEHVFAMALSSDGSFGVLAQPGGSIALVDIPRGGVRKAVAWSAQWLRAVALSPDDQLLVMTDDRGNVRVHSLVAGTSRDLQGNGRQIRSLAFAPSGKLVFAGGEDAAVRRIDLADMTVRVEPLEIGGEVWALDATDGILAIASESTPLRLWCWEDGREQAVERISSVSARSVRLSRDGRRAYVGCDDGTVHVWAVPGGEHLATIEAHAGPIWSLAIADVACAPRLFTASHDSTVRVWDLSDFPAVEEKLVLTEGNGPVWPLVLDRANATVAAVARNTSVRYWNAQTYEYLEHVRGSAGQTTAVVPLRDGRRFASGGQDGVVRVWDTVTADCVGELAGHEGGIRALAVNPAGTLLASASEDCECRVWDIAGLQLHEVLRGPGNWIWSIEFSACGRLLAAASADRRVHVWDIPFGSGYRELTGHRARVIGAHVTSRGEQLVSCSVDGEVWEWSLSTGEGSRLAHLNGVVTTSALVEDAFVALGDRQGAIHLLTLSGGREVARRAAHPGGVTAMSVRAKDAELLTGGEDGRLCAWTLPTLDPIGRSAERFGSVWALTDADEETVLVAGREREVTALGRESLRSIRRYPVPRQYEGLDITGVRGLGFAERQSLIGMGAVDTATPVLLAQPHVAP